MQFNCWISDMVAFPDSTTEPTLLNGTGLMSHNSNQNSNDNPADDANARRVKDQAFTIPRVTISGGKDNYALKFDSMDKINEIKLHTDNMNAEPVVKKVAGKIAKSQD